MDYSCAEHIEFLIEEWINRYERAPEMTQLDPTTKASCFWCQQKALYAVDSSDIGEDSPNEY